MPFQLCTTIVDVTSRRDLAKKKTKNNNNHRKTTWWVGLCNPARDKDHHHKKRKKTSMKYLSARERFLPFHIDVYAAVYKTKGHNFLSNKKKFYSRRLVVVFFFFSLFRWDDDAIAAPWGCYCSNMSSLSSNSHDTKCSNDRKTTTFGLLFNFKTCDFFDDEEVVHLVFHFEKKKIFQVEMKKNFLSLFSRLQKFG